MSDNLVADLLDRGAKALRAAGIAQARMEARLLLAEATGFSQEDLIAGWTAPNIGALGRYEALLARRVAREPMAYILGRRAFWSLEFAVGEGVLVPRPETETLIEEALAEFPQADAPLDVLDLGTGSGCLLLSFLHERPQAHGLGVDISADALFWAAVNTRTLGLGERVGLNHGRWTDNLSDYFDVIFINPPYIALEDRTGLGPEITYEPPSALFGGSDGFDAFREVAPTLAFYLKPGGKVFVEIGAGQAERAKAMFAASGLEILRVAPDLSGVGRCLVLERSPA